MNEKELLIFIDGVRAGLDVMSLKINSIQVQKIEAERMEHKKQQKPPEFVQTQPHIHMHNFDK